MDDQVQKKFGSLYIDIDVEREGTWQLLYTTNHCLRRIITVLAVVLLTDYFFLQLWIMIAHTFLQQFW